MLSGDYMVHIFVQKLKEINLPENDTIDAMFQFECLGAKGFTTAKANSTSLDELVYNEHIFMEVRDVDKKQVEEGKLVMKLMDKGFLKDKMIGQYEMDLSYIYLKPGHKFQHKWYAFSNPNGDDYAKIQCYCKFSIAITREGDESVELKEDTAIGEDPEVMMSPALSPKFFQVTIRLFAGHDLPMMDAGIGMFTKEKIDAYMKLEFKKKTYKTKVIKYFKGDQPISWNTEFLLPCQLPVASPMIPIKLMDEDDIGSDEVAATMLFFTKDIVENKGNKNGLFIWKNLYGAPLGQSNSKEKEMMNENPEFASSWKGRILV